MNPAAGRHCYRVDRFWPKALLDLVRMTEDASSQHTSGAR